MNRVTAAVTCVVLLVSLRSSIFLKANVLVVAQWFRNLFFLFEIFNITDKTIDWVFVRKKTQDKAKFFLAKLLGRRRSSALTLFKDPGRILGLYFHFCFSSTDIIIFSMNYKQNPKAILLSLKILS